MKLEDCDVGRMVITADNKIGRIVGVAWNCMDEQDKIRNTFSLVRFDGVEMRIRPGDLKPYGDPSPFMTTHTETQREAEYTASNLRAMLYALISDEDRGCDRKHLDGILGRLAHRSNSFPAFLAALEGLFNEFPAPQCREEVEALDAARAAIAAAKAP